MLRRKNAGAASVERLDEIEAVRRRIEAERGAIAGFKRLAHIVGLPLAATDHRQAPDHRADLVVEEAARRRFDADLVAVTSNLESVERLYRAVGLAMGRAKGGEVVTSDEVRCAFLHGV